MTKELQDLAWSVLPKEFKEEVKKEWQTANKEERLPHDAFLRGCYSTMILLFGLHNLTSDVEEDEDEMLYVSRKKLQYFYEKLRAVGENRAAFTLQSLFGSKCLPDETLSQNPPENRDTENHISTDCDKAAEPKFKVGDIATIRGLKHPLLKSDGAIVTILSYHDKGDFYSCAIAPNVGIDVEAKYLEPYTSPTEKNPKESDETFASDEPTTTKSDDFDRIVRDGFRNHNRLHIAAMAMQGLLANRDWMKEKQFYAHTHSEDDPDKAAAILIKDIAEDAMEFADALITECDKGGTDGED